MDEETQFSNSITLGRAYVELSSTLFFYLFMSRENEIIIYSIKKGGGRVVIRVNIESGKEPRVRHQCITHDS